MGTTLKWQVDGAEPELETGRQLSFGPNGVIFLWRQNCLKITFKWGVDFAWMNMEQIRAQINVLPIQLWTLPIVLMLVQFNWFLVLQEL